MPSRGLRVQSIDYSFPLSTIITREDYGPGRLIGFVFNLVVRVVDSGNTATKITVIAGKRKPTALPNAILLTTVDNVASFFTLVKHHCDSRVIPDRCQESSL